MRIFHYLRSVINEDGGVVRVVLDSCDLLAKASHQVTLASSYPIDVPTHWLDQNDNTPKVLDLRRYVLWDMFFNREGRLLLEEEIFKADIVYLHEMWRPENAQLAKIARRLKKPYVVPLYGMLDPWPMNEKRLKKKIYYALLGRQFLQGARFLQCVSNEEQIQARYWVPEGKWVVMPYLIDMGKYVRFQDESSGKSRAEAHRDITFLFLSRFHPKKGAELLIDATGVLKENGHRFKVLLSGAGEERYIEKLQDRIKRAGLDNTIHFVGSRFGREKLALYDSVDAFVLPSLSDNFGIVLIEALGCGLPVITTNKVDIWKTIEVAGAKIIDLDVHQLAIAMEAIIEMPEGNRLSLSRKGRNWVNKNFDSNRLLSMYQDMHGEASRLEHGGQFIDYSDRFH